MQLIKLVYLAHAWHLGLYGVPLINDEIQAWQYGPVIPRLYQAVKAFRSHPVKGPLANFDEQLDPAAESTIMQVYDIYGQMPGPALSRLTHAPGSPWAETYIPGSFGLEISNDIIEDHYARLAQPQ
jgi:uncharacterized phage-associated protein